MCSKKPQIQNRTEQLLIPAVQKTHLRENEVDDNASATSKPGWLVGTGQICRAAEELGLIVDVLEWTLRAPKHARRPTLRTLLSEIEESINHLEKAFESFAPPGDRAKFSRPR